MGAKFGATTIDVWPLKAPTPLVPVRVGVGGAFCTARSPPSAVARVVPQRADTLLWGGGGCNRIFSVPVLHSLAETIKATQRALLSPRARLCPLRPAALGPSIRLETNVARQPE